MQIIDWGRFAVKVHCLVEKWPENGCCIEKYGKILVTFIGQIKIGTTRNGLGMRNPKIPMVIGKEVGPARYDRLKPHNAKLWAVSTTNQWRVGLLSVLSSGGGASLGQARVTGGAAEQADRSLAMEGRDEEEREKERQKAEGDSPSGDIWQGEKIKKNKKKEKEKKRQKE